MIKLSRLAIEAKINDILWESVSFICNEHFDNQFFLEIIKNLFKSGLLLISKK
jgi:hypothetical protein